MRRERNKTHGGHRLLVAMLNQMARFIIRSQQPGCTAALPAPLVGLDQSMCSFMRRAKMPRRQGFAPVNGASRISQHSRNSMPQSLLKPVGSSQNQRKQQIWQQWHIMRG